MSIKRPLSPHIQVYNLMFKISSLTSLLHRGTGAALVVGSMIIVWWLMAIAHGSQSYENFQSCISSPLGQLVLVGFSWAFWYQLLNGVRHLAWDAGYGYKLSISKLTGLFVMGASVVATLATWIYLWGAI